MQYFVVTTEPLLNRHRIEKLPYKLGTTTRD